jgi:hypothetical protein
VARAILQRGLQINPDSGCLAQAWGLMELQKGNAWAAVRLVSGGITYSSTLVCHVAVDGKAAAATAEVQQLHGSQRIKPAASSDHSTSTSTAPVQRGTIAYSKYPPDVETLHGPVSIPCRCPVLIPCQLLC